MSHSENRARINLVKFLELGFAIACLVLHYYSYDDRDILASLLSTGTFAGYIIVILEYLLYYGLRTVYSFWCFCYRSLEHSFRTRTRDMALIKASLSIVNGVLFGFDAIFTFRDMMKGNENDDNDDDDVDDD
ncbi:hypothetical protein DOY81_009937 [Sarcophaga bullata]|nr:hypothetical protein DOY81_009937 [Sarcophaga bullata]